VARRPRHLAAVVLALLAVGCGDDADRADGATRDEGNALEGSITVFAAASLTDAFTALADAFEARHPGTSVALSFAGSSTLREQLLAGAPGDVVAPADEATMDQLVETGVAAGPTAIATNELQLVVPAGNPGDVEGLADLADDDLLVGLCAEPVPCGRLGRAALAAARVTASVDTEEPDVRALLTKVAAGELDVGLVYRTDVLAGGDAVEGIVLPADQVPATRSPIAVLTDTHADALSGAFVAFVASPAGQAVLAEHGFGPP